LYKSSYHFLSLFTDDLGLSSRYVLHIDADVRLIGVPQPLGTSGAAVPSAASAWPSVGTRGAVERSPLAQALTMVATQLSSRLPSQLSHHVAISIVPRCDRACLILEPRCMDDSRRSRALLRGRLAPSLDDIEALAEPALGHRMALAYDPTGQGGTLSALIQELAAKAA
jgi:hypothetical protein